MGLSSTEKYKSNLFAWIDSRAKIQADVTVQRMEGEKFMVVTGAAFLDHVKYLLNRELRALDNTEVSIEDWTQKLALLNIQGPMSRKVLKQIICKEKHVDDDDISNERFPFATAKVLRLRNGVDATVCRLTYVGENGYELYVPMSEAVSVAQLIMESDSDVRLAGMEASKKFFAIIGGQGVESVGGHFPSCTAVTF